ncbi:MAG: hydrogenase maturation protease [Candidatus Heimdallarchaeaceae archaeon]
MSSLSSFFTSFDAKECAFICLGNKDRADDGIGLIIAEKLSKFYPKNVFSEEEEDISTILLYILDKEQYKQVILIDAVEFGAEPGSLLVSSKIETNVKQISTHTIPYQEISRLLESKSREFLFIGIQVKSLTFLEDISEEVLHAADRVMELLT